MLDAKCRSLSVVAQDVFELYATYPYAPAEPLADATGRCSYPGIERAEDIRLSTAAVLSARFPVVTPAGALRFRNKNPSVQTGHDGELTAFAVDGGYFDNSGIETLMPVMSALDARGVRFVVLHLTNESWFFKGNVRAGRPYAEGVRQILPTELTPPGQGFWSQTLALLSEPLDTLLALRTGHQAAALERLQSTWPGKVMTLRVEKRIYNRAYPETPLNRASLWCKDRPHANPSNLTALYQPVMSWWLSYSSQRAIDAQLCDQTNIGQLSRLLKLLERDPGTERAGGSPG